MTTPNKARLSGLFGKLIFVAIMLVAILLPKAKPQLTAGFSLVQPEKILSQKQISLENRYSVPSVNTVFKDNILLNLAYMQGTVKTPSDIDWFSLNKPNEFGFTLEPGQTFAYHDTVLPELTGKIAKTTNAHFNAQDGFKTDGYLYGDGVCHLASLMYWAAKDAGLEAKSQVNHNFANIPEIPREYGVSIYYMPGDTATSSQQNLYITNNKNKPVTFAFAYDGKNLSVKVIEQQS